MMFVGAFAPRLRVLAPLDAVLEGLGLEQYWSMFAPDVSAWSVRCYAVIRLSSGGALRWDPPRVDATRVTAWVGFRRRLFELMIATVGGEIACRSFAVYLADTYRRDGDPPIEVVIVRVTTTIEGGAATETIVARFAAEDLVAVSEPAR
jgi:hypothetical protein